MGHRFRRLWAAAAVVAAGLALLALRVGVAQATPPEPASVWGEVRINGVYAPNGTRVEIWSGGQRLDDTHAVVVTDPYTATVYIFDLPGDDPETPAVEGLKPGAQLQFRIYPPGMLVACTQTATYQPGVSAEVDLSCERVAPATVIRLPLLTKKR